MELSINILNFEDGEQAQEFNSPRTMEACLRVGVDPSELYPRARSEFAEKGFSVDMVKTKYTFFERKRKEKIENVQKERDAIIKFAAKKSASQPNSPSKPSTSAPEKDGSMGLVEAEEKRMEALKRRQEKELAKIMEREKAMAELQEKVARAEQEEHRKKKAHIKAVAATKAEAEKKAKMRAKEVAAKEHEEEERKREIARKERAFTEKMTKIAAEEKIRLAKEARQQDEERKRKVEEGKRKTAELLKAQADQAERNRIIMVEREERVQEQMREKKARKAEEVAQARARAKVRIDAALEKHHEMSEKKKRDFDEAQAKAQVLLKEKQKAETIAQREALERREKRNIARTNRLVQSFEKRADHRDAIQEHMDSKDGGYERLWEERMKKIEFEKFVQELKMREKQENVQQTLRKQEFKRLQTLARIEDVDLRYEHIQGRKADLMSSFRMEQKRSLTRKHAIADAMECMKVTGDTKMLDRIFAEGKKKGGNASMRDDDDDDKAATTAM